MRNRITVAGWASVPRTELDPQKLPATFVVAAALNQQRPSVTAPGGPMLVDLKAFRAQHSPQQLAFQMAADLTRHYVAQSTCEAPPHVLFPQIFRIVQRYLSEKVEPRPPAHLLDAFVSPYYGWIIERLLGAIRPDTESGEQPEVPDIDEDRPLRTADISVFTPKPVSEAARTHPNVVVCDTISWEQSAAYQLDRHRAVRSFVKNHGLQFAIPYFHNDKASEYHPDFVVRLKADDERYLIAELKGADWEGNAEIKAQAAARWCAAVNATKRFDRWNYVLARNVSDLVAYLDTALTNEALTSSS